jgi:hypothetical protein
VTGCVEDAHQLLALPPALRRLEVDRAVPSRVAAAHRHGPATVMTGIVIATAGRAVGRVRGHRSRRWAEVGCSTSAAQLASGAVSPGLVTEVAGVSHRRARTPHALPARGPSVASSHAVVLRGDPYDQTSVARRWRECRAVFRARPAACVEHSSSARARDHRLPTFPRRTAEVLRAAAQHRDVLPCSRAAPC